MVILLMISYGNDFDIKISLGGSDAELLFYKDLRLDDIQKDINDDTTSFLALYDDQHINVYGGLYLNFTTEVNKRMEFNIQTHMKIFKEKIHLFNHDDFTTTAFEEYVNTAVIINPRLSISLVNKIKLNIQCHLGYYPSINKFHLHIAESPFINFYAEFFILSWLEIGIGLTPSAWLRIYPFKGTSIEIRAIDILPDPYGGNERYIHIQLRHEFASKSRILWLKKFHIEATLHNGFFGVPLALAIGGEI